MGFSLYLPCSADLLLLSSQQYEINPISIFKSVLRPAECQRRYLSRFTAYLDFLKLQGSLENQASEFVKRAMDNPK
jgi:hypothetical protein